MHETSEPSVTELLFDQLEELVVTIVEEVRERPGVAVAILAAVLGAVIGTALATRGRKRAAPISRLSRSALGVADTGELMGLGMKLLQNPIVRGFLLSTVQKQLRNRFSL